MWKVVLSSSSTISTIASRRNLALIRQTANSIVINRQNLLPCCRPLTFKIVSPFTPTSHLMEKKTVPVPSMGDSITEGTIVEWVAAVGQSVKEDDVVALVETDKVTIDIKAEMDGVIVKHHGNVDDNVEVGADLYDIDTEATATVEATTLTENTEKNVEQEAQAPSPSSSGDSLPEVAAAPAGRTPSIHFLGKDGWSKRLRGQTEEQKPLVPDKPNGVIVLDGSMLDAHYGRPVVSDKEMEALMMGGANVAPSVVQHSAGASFSSQ